MFIKQAGTGSSQRHIQDSKIAKRLPSVKYSLLQYSKIENFSKKNFRKNYIQKNGPSGAPGPASASPWRAKRGTRPKLSTFLSQLKGDPSEKKISQCRKTERALWDFKHPICCKISKKLKGGPFGEKKFRKKISQCRKNCKGDPLGVSNIHSDAKQKKKLKGDPLRKTFFSRKKSRSAEKK